MILGLSPLKYLVLLAILLSGFTETPAAAEISYLRTLRLPAQGESDLYPKSVTADLHTGEIFVCDTRGNRVLIFDPDGLFNYEITGGVVFRAPTDIGIDPEGYLLLLASRDLRRVVLELDFDGLFLREIEVQNLPADALEPRIISLALSQKGDRLYLLDQANLRVWITDRKGQVQGSFDVGEGMTENQRRDAILRHVDVSGEMVLVSVPRVGRVNTYDLDGSFVGSTGDSGTAGCEMSFPVATAVDARGNYLVVDSHRGVFSTWNPTTNECLGDHFGFGTAPGYLYFPTDLALDGQGLIYVSQPFEGRIQVYQGEAAAVGVSSEGTIPPSYPEAKPDGP